MATEVARLSAILDADTSRFDRGMNRAEGRMSRGMKVLGRAALLGGAAVGAGMAVGAVKAIGAASDLNESVNAVNVVFGKAAGTIEDFSQRAAREAGLSMVELNTLVTPIGAALRNVGLTAGEAADASVDLAKRAADMASVFNVDVADAMQAIQAGLRGEMDPLERFGVGLSDAAITAYAVKEGMAAAGAELTTQQKVQARLGLLFEQTNRVAGDFVNTSDGLANQQRILKAEFANVTAEIGTALLPVATKLMSWAVQLIPVLRDLSEKVMEKFRAVVDSVSGSVGGFRDAGQSAFETVQRLARRLVGWSREHLLPIFDALKDAVQDALQEIVVVIRRNRPQLMQIWNALRVLLEKIAWILRNVVVPILRFVFTQILPRVIEVAIKSVAALITVVGKFRDFLSFVRATATFTFNWVRDKVNVARDAVSAVILKIRQMIQWIKDIPAKVGDALGWLGGKFEFIANLVPGAPPRGGFGGLVVGPGGGTLDSATALAARFGLPVSSGYRPGDPGWHGQNRARDYAGPAGQMLAFARAAVAVFGSRLLELIHSPLGFGVKNGVRVPNSFWGADVIADHFDHVHLAMDKAGWHMLRPGLNLVGNYTGRPEPVYATGRGGRPAPTTIILANHGVIGSEREVLAWLDRALEKRQRRGGGG